MDTKGVEVVFIYALLILITVPVLPQFLGNSKITLIRLEKCSEDDPGVKLNVSIQKVNRTHQGINVFLDSAYDLDHTVAINATTAKWGDGGWKPHAFDYYDGNACETFMRFAKKDFSTVLESIGRKPTCPVSKGKFSVKNYIFDGKVGVQTMYGDFRADIALDKGGKTMTCVRMFLKCEPPKAG